MSKSLHIAAIATSAIVGTAALVTLIVLGTQEASKRKKQVLRFYNRFYNNVSRGFYSLRQPLNKYPLTEEVLFNDQHALFLDIHKADRQELQKIFTYEATAKSSVPLSQRYSGYQFGQLAQLGDGRAVLLGSLRAWEGSYHEVQLKGSGKTPFSRRGDGKLTLEYAVREYLLSEAMNALHEPTTRALACYKTHEGLARGGVWNGGAVLVRTARSFVRYGTFHAVQSRNEFEELVNHACATVYKQLIKIPWPARAVSLLYKIVARQANTVAGWTSLGFVHGVVNTDNMLITGETIDYGPCAFLDNYDPAQVYSSIDVKGRYALKNQGPISVWNAGKLAESFLAHAPDLHINVKDVQTFAEQKYALSFCKIMRAKFGIQKQVSNVDAFGLVKRLLNLLQNHDYTDTIQLFQQAAEKKSIQELLDKFPDSAALIRQWASMSAISETSLSEKDHLLRVMQSTNPKLVPRNHVVRNVTQLYIANDNPDILKKALEELRAPYDTDPVLFIAPKKGEAVLKTFCGT